MPWTNTTLTAALQSYTQSTEATFVATIPTIIRQAEDRINKAAILPVNRKNGTVTITASQVTATLPTDFLAPFELRMVASNVYTAVEYVDVSFIREAYPTSTTTGVPKYYSMYNSTTIILGPTPTSGLSGWLNYFFKPASITDGSATWIGDNAEDCLLYGCLSEAYTFLKGEQDLQTLYEGRFQEQLANLKTLGEGLDLGDSFRMGERRLPR